MERPKNFTGWIKYFSDSSRLLGDDNSVDKKLVSWRRDQNKPMVAGSVSQSYKDVTITAEIRGPGLYWCSDDLIAPMARNSNVTGTRVARRIEKRLSEEDKFLMISHGPVSLIVSTVVDLSLPLARTIPLPKNSENNWLIVELDLKTRDLFWYISEVRI